MEKKNNDKELGLLESSECKDRNVSTFVIFVTILSSIGSVVSGFIWIASFRVVPFGFFVFFMAVNAILGVSIVTLNNLEKTNRELKKLREEVKLLLEKRDKENAE
ncbi:MAG: hypothetical protein FWB72_04055 [Firmicutes bacterium]|nr:hypothetical protein [Bacillota bacterium]